MRQRDNMPTQYPDDGKVHVKWDEDLYEVKNFKKNSIVKSTLSPAKFTPKSILKATSIEIKPEKPENFNSDTDASSGREDAELKMPDKALIYKTRFSSVKARPKVASIPKPKNRKYKAPASSVGRLEHIMLSKLKRTYGIPITALY